MFFIYGTSNLNAGTIGDINNDDTVDTTEAVYALQVSAGISTKITSNENAYHSLDAADGNPKNALYVDNEGKVGIGTSFPSADLCVKANQNFNKELTGRATVGKDTTRVSGFETKFMKELSTGDIILIAGQIVSITKIIDDEQLILNEPHQTGALDEKIFISGDIISIKDNIGQNKIVVDKKGNIGIGTSNPGTKLDTNGYIIRNIQRASGIGLENEVFNHTNTTPEKIDDRVLKFTKYKDETAIRVSYMDFLCTWGDCLYCYYEIRFDGLSCPGGKIKYTNHNCHGGGQEYSRACGTQNFIGYCEGIKSGQHEIQIWLQGSSVGGNKKCVVGFPDSSWTIEVEEVYVGNSK